MNHRHHALLLTQARFALRLLHQAKTADAESRRHHTKCVPAERQMAPGSPYGATRVALGWRRSKLSRLGRLLAEECLEDGVFPSGNAYTTKCFVWAAVSKAYCDANFPYYSPGIQAILQPFHYRIHPTAADFKRWPNEPNVVFFMPYPHKRDSSQPTSTERQAEWERQREVLESTVGDPVAHQQARDDADQLLRGHAQAAGYPEVELDPNSPNFNDQLQAALALTGLPK